MALVAYYGVNNVISNTIVTLTKNSGDHNSGYFNNADISEPPKTPQECQGGLEKSFNFTYIENLGQYLDRVREIDGQSVTLEEHGTFMNMCGKNWVVIPENLQRPYVRIGACFSDFGYGYDPEGTTYNHEGYIDYLIPYGNPIKIKVIDTAGEIHTLDTSNENRIFTGSGSHQELERDPSTGLWYGKTIMEDPISESSRGTLGTGTAFPYSRNGGILSDDVTIESDIPFFDDESTLDIFLESGVMEDPEPDPDDPDDPNKAVYFYIETNTIKNTEPTEVGAEWVNHHRQEFYGVQGFRMGRYYVPDTTLPLNMKWKYSVAQTSPHTQFKSGSQIDYNASGGISEQNDYTSISDFINPWHCGEEWHQAPSGMWYKSSIQTNIALLKSENDDPQPPADDPTKPNPTGEDDPSTVLPPNTLDIVGGRIYLLSSSAMNDFIDAFFDSDDTIITALLKGLAMFGDNPTESIIDIYATPIDQASFCTSSSVAGVKVGNYPIPLSSGAKKVLTNRVMKTLGQVTIKGTYNDWRDLDATYILYLPYVGFINLDTAKYINKTFTIKMVSDVRTGNIKYYLFSGGNVLDTYEGCIHLSCPLTNANYHNIANKLVNGATSCVNAVSSSQSGNTGDIINSMLTGGLSAFQLGSTLAGARDFTTTGNWSSETAVNDCNYPYLIISQPEYLYPPRLYQEFGYPDDSIATLNNYSGYVKCDEINLQTTATSSEINEIESLLKEGVYI